MKGMTNGNLATRFKRYEINNIILISGRSGLLGQNSLADLEHKLHAFAKVCVLGKAVGTAEAGEVSASPLFCRSGRGFVCASAYYHVAF